ncbi:murein biosynthesis integral membrane protein MurJ [Clostridium sp. WLY-B-L2]|uniref:Probable lipid II flippase MurJ n=1 Tax=Clostridium aromativorans TaxID=2836848 RepID=A0ABS8N9S2_9CLOT|nr:murein biosynthesis integral membrane protein MurJ [Clostridium aromativorans]MCC9295904.1 murein biosynthesis integral membrane protein MurJ [Clostridium aromativorans]
MAGKKIIKSSVVVMLLIIGGKILAMVRDSLIAAKFGATYISDIYNFSLGLVYLLTTISYGLTTTFIPLNSEHIEHSSSKKRNEFVNNIITLSTFFTVIITMMLIVFSKQIVYVFGHAFTANVDIYSQSVEITRIMLLSLVFVTLQSVVTGVLQSHKKFYEPAAMALVSNLVYIVYLVFLTSRYGIKGFAVATVIGFFVQFAINLPRYRKLGYKYKFVMDIKNRDAHSMFKLMVPIIISTSVVQLNLFINRSFANNIYFGAVTVLDYSNKINTLAYEVFAIGIAMIVYPTLSELAVKKDILRYKKALVNAINIIMIIMIPAAVAIGILRHPLVNLIFRHGAFDLTASDLTSNALLFYCPAMIAYGIRDILNKAFYSIKDARTPMINSFVGIIINIIINFILIKHMKVSGLALATTISAIITTMLMTTSLNKKLNGMNMKKIFYGLLKISFSSTVMGVCIYTVNYICMNEISSFMWSNIISIFVSFVLGSAVYFICLHFTRIEEYEYILNAVKDKIPI